jgi:hypothetical protein
VFLKLRIFFVLVLLGVLVFGFSLVFIPFFDKPIVLLSDFIVKLLEKYPKAKAFVLNHF